MAKKKRPKMIGQGRKLARAHAIGLMGGEVTVDEIDAIDACSDYWEPIVREFAMAVGLFLQSDGQVKAPMVMAIGRIKQVLEVVPEAD